MSETQATPPAQLVDRFVNSAHGDLATVRALLEESPELLDATSSQNETAIQAATHTGQVPIIEFLLSQGAVLDICTASFLGREDDVRRMLDDDPDQVRAEGAHGLPLLYFPALGGNLAIARLLAERGAAVNGGEGLATPLHAAAMTGRLEMARWLVEQGASKEAKDYSGKTPIEVASGTDHHDVAEALG